MYHNIVSGLCRSSPEVLRPGARSADYHCHHPRLQQQQTHAGAGLRVRPIGFQEEVCHRKKKPNKKGPNSYLEALKAGASLPTLFVPEPAAGAEQGAAALEASVDEPEAERQRFTLQNA